ncbi:MAG TPA: hypothetical protein VGL83_05645 [Stellaceae bacterium]|jgi:hypothetical protein
MTERDERTANPDIAVEHTDMNVRVIAIIAVGVLLYICLAPFILTRIYHPALSDIGRQLAIHPPGPELQLNPAADLLKFRAKADAQLDSYGWVDRAKGIAHIPIDQAMRDVAAGGIPGFPKAPP